MGGSSKEKNVIVYLGFGKIIRAVAQTKSYRRMRMGIRLSVRKPLCFNYKMFVLQWSYICLNYESQN